MDKVTRTLQSAGLNRGKHDQLAALARCCGRVRREVWQWYREVAAALSSYKIRDA